MSSVMKKFEEEVLTKALTLIDKDELAKKLAVKLKKKFEEEFNEIEGNIDFGYIIQEYLNDEKSEPGKAFNAALNAIAKRMADAI